jgi:hypothetical protein
MSQFTSEEQLLLSSMRWLISGEPISDSADVDWRILFDLALDHNLEPLLDAAIPKEWMPDEIVEAVTLETRRRKMRAVVMTEDFRNVHESLNEAGIKVMPIKGIYLAQTVYPSLTLRYFDDIDLLVPASAGQAAVTILQDLGYIPHPRAPKPDWHHLPPYIHPKHNTMFEIHVDLVRRSRPGWDVDGIWRRAIQGRLGGLETWLMTWADALVNTALHARHNLYNRLSYFLDAALLARKLTEKGGTSPQLNELACKAGASCALAHVLRTAERMLTIDNLPEVPCPPTRRWLARRTVGWQSLAPSRNSLRQGALPKILEVSLMDSMGDSLRLARRLAVPPADFMMEMPDSDKGLTANYGRRFWKRISIAAQQLIQVFRGK